ncbi:PIF1-like helicase-domain-containing protein [Rhizoctonia solani]|nr:PIF1-like helicase-domain-containing protein [Rhizoctonia solani]
MSSDVWYALRIPGPGGFSTILTSLAEVHEALEEYPTVEVEWCQSFEEARAWVDCQTANRKSGSWQEPEELESPRSARIHASGPYPVPHLSSPSKANHSPGRSSSTGEMGASSSSMQIPGEFPGSPRHPCHWEESDHEYDMTQTNSNDLDLVDEQLDITPPSTPTTALAGSSSPVKGPASDGLSDYSYASDDFPEGEPDYDISPPATSQLGSSQPIDRSFFPEQSAPTSKTDPLPPAVPSVPPGDADIELTQEQKYVLDLVLQGKSVFFTGSAGTGKSVLLRKIIQTLRERRTAGVQVTASTGIAAANIQGETLHAFAGVGLGNQKREVLIARALKSRGVVPRWRSTRILIIDESNFDGSRPLVRRS